MADPRPNAPRWFDGAVFVLTIVAAIVFTVTGVGVCLLGWAIGHG